MRLQIGAALLAVLALAVASPDAWAKKKKPPKPVNPEFLINTVTKGAQSDSAVSALVKGGFVVTWTSDSVEDGTAVFAQRYDAKGVRSGPQLPVDTTGAANDPHPSAYASVAGLKNGNGGFVVVWQSGPMYSSDYEVYGQRFSLKGVRVGAKFQVNVATPDAQYAPRVAALNDGGFVVAWVVRSEDGTVFDIYARRYNIAGTPVAPEFRVNTNTDDQMRDPSVSGLSDGGFIITWSQAHFNNPLNQYENNIMGQRYNAAGAPVGSEFQLNVTQPGNLYASAVQGLSGGGFVAAWSAESYDEQGNYLFSDVHGQRFDAAGVKVGSQFIANTFQQADQGMPRVADLGASGFVITWESGGQEHEYGVYGQRYDTAGARVGTEFHVNATVIYDQIRPAVAGLGNGNFVVTWESSYQKEDSYLGVFGRIYSESASADEVD
jgi:hypothetical protein